jgi:hypothetical protein
MAREATELRALHRAGAGGVAPEEDDRARCRYPSGRYWPLPSIEPTFRYCVVASVSAASNVGTTAPLVYEDGRWRAPAS